MTALLLPALAALAPPVGTVEVELWEPATELAEGAPVVTAGAEEDEPAAAEEEMGVGAGAVVTPPGAVPFTQPGLVMVIGPEKSYCSP